MKKVGFGARDSGFVFATAILALTLASCSPTTAPQTEDLFPKSDELAGWVRTGETRTFAAANLWEYINGDAERYVQAGVEQTLTADYRYQNKADAVVDIHIMKSADGPRKLLESESAADSKSARVGEDARLYATSLVFRKGPYLVRVIAYEERPEIGKALVELGQAIEKKLGAGG